ncbi:hypothetical protein NDU88_003420 [Pleurodeles waltl]|uniref:Uncharacterized protein n=1 Tax=Pleurodeles waltl TaxID=8319 RepID=A0AAV7UF44_PLEWA|nr:hypothetical protein NDU88_003420 [Pleurodeles waltl]
MEAIRDLEPKLDSVMVDINLLRADFHMMSERVKTAELHIHLLQSTAKKLEDQDQCLTKQQAQNAAQVEDHEGMDCADLLKDVSLQALLIKDRVELEEELSEEEIGQAIRELQSGKAAGRNGIPVELY